MHRLTALARTPIVEVMRFDHPPHQAHVDPRAEEAPGVSVNFLLRGHYELSVAGSSWLMNRDSLFVTRPGLVYRCRHDDAEPRDVCLSVAFIPPEAGAEDLVRRGGVERPALPTVLPLRDRHAFLRWRLLRRLQSPGPDIELESLAVELRDAVGIPAPAPSRRHRESQLAWYAERVDAACGAMRTHPADDHSLASLARTAGMSAFHFARVFRDLVGVTPHRFLVRSRLATARQMLEGGALVTSACFESGFGSLSHFSTTFRRHFGVAPSRVVGADADASSP